MGNKIVHIELSAKNIPAMTTFYANVFGWEVEHFDELNYSTWKAGDGVGGGFNPVTPENPEGTVVIYIGTDNVTESLKAVEQAGGSIISPEMDIPNTGKFGLFRDPGGNLVGLFSPYPMP